MQIKNISNSIAFQKKLEANCAILKDSKPYPCKIFKLEKSDEGYFKNFDNDSDWVDSFFSDSIETVSKYDIPHCTYVLEDTNKKCLGYADISYSPNNIIEVDYLETCPVLINNPNVKYIGETLLAFLAKLAKKESSDVIIFDWIRNAEDFYTKNCGFECRDICGSNNTGKMYDDDLDIDEGGSFLILENSNCDKLLEKNKNHTKSGIDFLG